MLECVLQKFFYVPQILLFDSFEPLGATRMHSISLESPDKGVIDFYWVKSPAALLKYFISNEIASIFDSKYLLDGV